MGRSDLADIDFFRDKGVAQDPYPYYRLDTRAGPGVARPAS